MQHTGPDATLNGIDEILPSELYIEIIMKLDAKSFMGENDVQLVSKFWQKTILFNRTHLPKATKANLLAAPNSKHEVLSILRDKITRESLSRYELLHLVGFNDDLLEGIHKSISIKDSFEMAEQNTALALLLYSQVTSAKDKSDLKNYFFKLAEKQVAIAELMYADEGYMKYISSQNLYTLCKHRSVFEKAKWNDAHLKMLGFRGPQLANIFNETTSVAEVNHPRISDWKSAAYDFFKILNVEFNPYSNDKFTRLDNFLQWMVDILNPEANNYTLEEFYFQFAICAVDPTFDTPLPFRFDPRRLAKWGNEGWEIILKMLQSDKLNQHLTSYDLQFILVESQKAGRIIFENVFNEMTLFDEVKRANRNTIYPLSFKYAQKAIDLHRKHGKKGSMMEESDLVHLCVKYPALYKHVKQEPKLMDEIKDKKEKLEKNLALYDKIVGLVDTQWAEIEMKRLKI